MHNSSTTEKDMTERTEALSGEDDRLERIEARNDALEAENEALRDRLDALETTIEEIAPGSADRNRASDGGASETVDAAVPAGGTAGYRNPVQPDGGQAFKVVGELDDEAGIGVLGRSTADLGTTYGVKGVSESSDSGAAALYADAPNGAIGLRTVSNGNYGIEAEATDWTAVHVETDGEHWNAIHGINSATTGWSWGVRGDTSSESENAYGVRGTAESTSGAAVGVGGATSGSGDGAAGVSGEAMGSSGETYGVYGTTASDTGYGVYSEGNSKTEGTHEVTDDLWTSGRFYFADETVQRTAGPIAKASISSDGTIDNAVNVDSVTWDGSRYIVELTDVNYFFNEYVTSVTPRSADYPVPRTSSVSGDLIVEFDDAGQHRFHFVVYELPDGTETTTSSSAVTDESATSRTGEDSNGSMLDSTDDDSDDFIDRQKATRENSS